MSMLLIIGGLVIGAIISAIIMDGRTRYDRMRYESMREQDREHFAGVYVEWSPLPIPDDDEARRWARWMDQPNPRGGLR